MLKCPHSSVGSVSDLQSRGPEFGITSNSDITRRYPCNMPNSTTVIAKIKGMPRSLFYDTPVPCYVTMDYEK